MVHPDQLAAAIVAFANTDGGQLIFGVTDSGRVVGVEDPDKICREVDNVAANNCEPPITIVLEVPRIGSKRVVAVSVPKGEQRPYGTNRGVHYVRTTSGRRQASREELLRLFQSSESLYYDETPWLRAGMKDLDLDAFRLFLANTSHGALEFEPERLLRS